MRLFQSSFSDRVYVSRRMSEIYPGLNILKNERWIQKTESVFLFHLCQVKHSVQPASEMCPDGHGFLTLSLSLFLAHNLKYKTARPLPIAANSQAWKLERSRGCIHLQIHQKLSLQKEMFPLPSSQLVIDLINSAFSLPLLHLSFSLLSLSLSSSLSSVLLKSKKNQIFWMILSVMNIYFASDTY